MNMDYDVEAAPALKYNSWYRRFALRKATSLRNPTVLSTEGLILPRPSTIHYIPEVDTELGPDRHHALLRNAGDRILTYHVDELKIVRGNARKAKGNVNSLARTFHKRNRSFSLAKDIERARRNISNHLVINYALLPSLYTYTASNLRTYNEWANMRQTMWDQIAQMHDERYQFIRVKLPAFIPALTAFNRYGEKFTTTGLENFSSPEAFDLLELWQTISPDHSGIEAKIETKYWDRIIFTFVESGQCASINLNDLIEWSRNDEAGIRKMFHSFLESMLSYRAVPEVDDEGSEVVLRDHGEEHVGNGVLNDMLKALYDGGGVTEGQRKGLIKLAQAMPELPDPINPELKLKDSKVTPEDMEIDTSVISTPINGVVDESMYRPGAERLDKDYVAKLYHKHINLMVGSVVNGGVVVKKYSAKPMVDAGTDAMEYSVTIVPVGGKQSTLKFTVPNLAPDGTMLSRGVKSRMTKQRGDLPIAKIKSHTVGLTSYYGKVFVVRNQNSVSNYGKWIQRQILALVEPEFIVTGENTYRDDSLPRKFTAVGEHFRTLRLGDNHFQFDPEVLAGKEYQHPKLKANRLVPVGLNKKDVLGMDRHGIVYRVNDSTVLELGTIPNLISPDLGIGPAEYTEVSVYSKRIPMICAFLYRYGLDNALRELKLQVTRLPKGARNPVANSEDYYRLKLKDEDLLIKMDTPELKLLVNGLNAVRKTIKGYPAAALNKKHPYTAIMSPKGLTTFHLKEIDLMWDMWVDPLTAQYLEEMDEPTEMNALLLRSNELLITDHFPKNPGWRLRGYERISGMVYSQMVASVRSFRHKRAGGDSELTMHPHAVYLDILQDQTVSLVEESNPIHAAKEAEATTFAGKGGRSALTMVKSSRVFGDDDLGVISSDSPDSDKVGVRTFMTANPGIKDLSGNIKPYDPKSGPASVLSTSSMLAPAITKDTMKRVIFTSIQNSRSIGAVGYQSLPYSTGADRTFSKRDTGYFAVTAQQDGEVIGLTDEILTVRYMDGTEESMEIGRKYGTASGTTIPHDMVTGLSKGDRFKVSDTLSYNKIHFKPDIYNPKSVVLTPGVVSTIALLESSETDEDGSTISGALADKLSVPTSKKRTIMVEFGQIIHNLLQVGDTVAPDTILCTLEDAVSAHISDARSDAAASLNRIAAKNPRAETDGTVARIEVLYRGNIDDMSETLAAIVKADNRRRARMAKTLGGRTVKTGEIKTPMHVDGNDLLNNMVAITLYMDSHASMGNADKLVFGNQLKSTVSRVLTEPMLSESGTVIDGIFAMQSIADRTTNSPIEMGIMMRLVPAINLEFARIYRNQSGGD